MQSLKTYTWHYTKDDLKFCPRCGAHLTLQKVESSPHEQLVCHACRFIFYLPPQLVVMAVVTHAGRILLLRRAEPPGQGRWALLAGFVDRNEDPGLALQREAREETGLELSVDKIMKVNSFPAKGMVQLIFLATAHSDHLILNDECLDGRFFTFADIPWDDLAFESTRQTLLEFGDANQQAHSG